MQRSPTSRARASNASRSPFFARSTSACCTRLSLFPLTPPKRTVTLESRRLAANVQSSSSGALALGDVAALAGSRVDVDAHAPVRRGVDEYLGSRGKARFER